MTVRYALSVIACVVIIILIIVLAAYVMLSAGRGRRGVVSRAGGADEDEPGDDLELSNVAAVRETQYSTLRPDQAGVVEEALKKHFTAPRHIIDATAHVGGDTINFMRVYPQASVTAIEIKPGAFGKLEQNVQAAEKELGRARGRVRLVHGNCIEFLSTTDEKADFVYLDPPWGGPECRRASRLDLDLADAGGKRWDITDVVKLVFQRGIAPYVVLKAPHNFKTADFSSRLEVPVVVHPIGVSPARHSSVSYWLIIVGGAMHEPGGAGRR